MASKKKTNKQNKKPEKRPTRRELKIKAVDYKGGHCELCGYSKSLAALTFHHRDPAEKDFGISDLLKVAEWKQIKRELDKCDLLCSNCHSEIHDAHLDGYTNNDNIGRNEG